MASTGRMAQTPSTAEDPEASTAQTTKNKKANTTQTTKDPEKPKVSLNASKQTGQIAFERRKRLEI